jgi:hypothetical protein
MTKDNTVVECRRCHIRAVVIGGLCRKCIEAAPPEEVGALLAEDNIGGASVNDPAASCGACGKTCMPVLTSLSHAEGQ